MNLEMKDVTPHLQHIITHKSEYWGFFASPKGEADQAKPGRVRGNKFIQTFLIAEYLYQIYLYLNKIMQINFILFPSPAASRRPLPPERRKTREWHKILLFFLLLFFSSLLFAAPAQNIYNFKTIEQQNQFDELTQNLRCLVCQNQTLAESNAPLAQDLRTQIYQMVQDQKSNQEIKSYLIQRYGNFVSYNPPFNPSTYVLWGLPAILLLGGIVTIRRLSS